MQQILEAQKDTLLYPKLLTLQEQKQKLKCPHKIPAFSVCIDSKCQVAGLMCRDSSCQCTKTHYKCHHIQIDRVLDSIDKHQKQLPQEVRESYKTTHKIINEMLDELSKIRNKLYLEQRYFGLTEKELSFMTLIDQQKIDNICGKIVSELEKTFEAEISFMILSHEDILRDFQMIKPEFDSLCKHIEDNYTKFNLTKVKSDEKEKGKLPLNKWQKKKEIEKQKLKEMEKQMEKKYYINDSKILKQSNQKEVMHEWLKETSNKKELFPKLLFRASEHNFSAAKFHELCDGLENTLVIVKTEFDKVIGGFTPKKWHAGNHEYVNDETGKAFLFSLTLKEKYKCKNTTKSILCYKTHGPLFGGCDICIDDNAHNSSANRADFPESYNLQLNGTSKYQRNQQTYTLFSGATKGNYFKVKQYQVYEIKGM